MDLDELLIKEVCAMGVPLADPCYSALPSVLMRVIPITSRYKGLTRVSFSNFVMYRGGYHLESDFAKFGHMY